MAKNEYFVTHSGGCCLCDSISREREDGSFDQLSYDDIVNQLNKLNEENQALKQTIKKMGELGGFNKHMIKTICGDLE